MEVLRERCLNLIYACIRGCVAGKRDILGVCSGYL